jgi:hypothetical protein
MAPPGGSRLARFARERPELESLVAAWRRVLRPARRLRKRVRREYGYWRKHELGWVLAILVLTRRRAPRSRVLRALAQPGVEKLRGRWPSGPDRLL